MTAPFAAAFEASLKDTVQNCDFSMRSGFVINPQWFCCISGTNVGVDKDPVAKVFSRPTTVCAGAAVTVDYSNSYSPSSTINTWHVAWGDGQTSNGAWPGAGMVNHPLGGYVLPGTYTITLTVTDLLGATGKDTQQINVIDCTAGPAPIVVAGCGSSGAWYSLDGGLNWQSFGLDGVTIYDLKVSLLTGAVVDFYGNVSLDGLVCWAATSAGLYRSYSGSSWTLQVLPEPQVGLGAPTLIAAVCPSKTDPFAVYVLTQASDGSTWLYHWTGIRGVWEWLELDTGGGGISAVLEDAGGATNYDMGHKIIPSGDANTTAWAVDEAGQGTRYRDNAQAWHEFGEAGENLNVNIDIFIGAGRLTSVGTGGGANWDDGAFIPSLTRFISGADPCNPPAGTDYITIPQVGAWTANKGGNLEAVFVDGTQIWVLWPSGAAAWYSCTGALGCCAGMPVALPGTSGNPKFIGPQHPVAPTPGFDRRIWLTTDTKIYNLEYDLLAGPSVVTFTQEWTGSPPPGDNIFLYSGSYYVARDTKKLLKFNGVGAWADDALACTENITCAHAWDDGHSIALGTATGVYILDGGAYTKIVSLPNVERVCCIIEGGDHIVLALTTGGIYRINADGAPDTALVVPASGRKHLLDLASDDAYIYVAALKHEDNTPIVIRVGSDFSLNDTTVIYEPGAGTWAGVACDFYDMRRMWIFGHMGAAKVIISDDDGDTLSDVTDGSWAAGELVRPLLVSIYSADDAIVVLNTNQETWQTIDGGNLWQQAGAIATPWAAQCGVRDYVDDNIVYIGVLAEGADNIQATPNAGYNWRDRSLLINAKITALEIVG